MSSHTGTVASGIFAISLAVCVVAPAAAQPTGPQGDSYASIVMLPDWSGTWVRPWADFEAENTSWRDPANPNAPKLTEAGIKAQEAAQRISRETLVKGATAPAPQAGTCGPGVRPSVPGVMKVPFGIEFLFTPGRVTMLLEVGSSIRRIHTDGRRHTTDADPTYLGESLGHWEGDTLVVDTTSIKEGVSLAPGIRSSGKMRLVERMRRIEPARLQIDTLIEDPVVLREPWRYSMTYQRSTVGWMEQECDSDRDGRDQEPDLTPPK